MMDHNEWPTSGDRRGRGAFGVGARTMCGVIAVLLLVGGLQAAQLDHIGGTAGACSHIHFCIYIISNLFCAGG